MGITCRKFMMINLALTDPEKSYGYLIEQLGARILQTDQPAYLLDYLRKKGWHN